MEGVGELGGEGWLLAQEKCFSVHMEDQAMSSRLRPPSRPTPPSPVTMSCTNIIAI